LENKKKAEKRIKKRIEAKDNKEFQGIQSEIDRLHLDSDDDVEWSEFDPNPKLNSDSNSNSTPDLSEPIVNCWKPAVKMMKREFKKLEIGKIKKELNLMREREGKRERRIEIDKLWTSLRRRVPDGK
jgi:hypothetical protein